MPPVVGNSRIRHRTDRPVIDRRRCVKSRLTAYSTGISKILRIIDAQTSKILRLYCNSLTGHLWGLIDWMC